jgi:hypothetical protein
MLGQHFVHNLAHLVLNREECGAVYTNTTKFSISSLLEICPFSQWQFTSRVTYVVTFLMTTMSRVVVALVMSALNTTFHRPSREMLTKWIM